ncbi:MAG: alpha-galactosidase [Lachnospira sp.]|nr:alpha-galactosidase [Lachnospira sp.]
MLESFFSLEKKVLKDENGIQEFQYRVTNQSDEAQRINKIEMYRVESLDELGISSDECKFFRSGRHKNDMPSVFTFGKMDEAMMDALGGMSESGDKVIAGNESEQYRILSDQLSVIGNDHNYVLIGFMTGRDQLLETEVLVDQKGDFVRLVTSVTFNIIVKPGQTLETEILRVERTDCAEKAIDAYAKEKAIQNHARRGLRPSVFCTWYYYGLTVTYDDVKMNLSEMKKKKLPFDVFQVDEGWEITLGEWRPNEKFPVPMKQVADEIKEAGYRPGIWTSPFIAHATAGIWQEHPDWKLRNKQGEAYEFPMNDTVYNVIDITNPETWNYFTQLYAMLTKEWGYSYHKLDFTRAAILYDDADYYDPAITIVRAYYEAVCAIRKGMGDDAYFLMCGGLYDPLIGVVDAQRTSSDVLSMWSSNINKDGKTAPYTIKQNILRYYMNQWWDNDPDALMVRINENMERGLRLTYGLLNDEEVKTTTVNQFIGGGIVCSTEPLDKICDNRLYQLQHVMPALKSTVSPVDIMNYGRFPGAIVVHMNQTDSYSITFMNWSDDEEIPVYMRIVDYIGNLCEHAEQYRWIASDFYSGNFIKDLSINDDICLCSLKPHASTVIKIEKYESDKPYIIGSTGHYSMGAEVSRLELTEDGLALEYKNSFDHPVTYKVLLTNNDVVLIER